MSNPIVSTWRDGDSEHGYSQWYHEYTCPVCGADLDPDQAECFDCGEEVDWDFADDEPDNYAIERDRKIDLGGEKGNEQGNGTGDRNT